MAAMTAQEFNRYTGQAKALAQEEPVFVTERGKIAYVLLNIDTYENLNSHKEKQSMVNPFSMSEDDFIALEDVRIDGAFRAVDFE